MIEKQWRRRDERERLVALASQSQHRVDESGENSGHWEGEAGVTPILEEVGWWSSLVNIDVFTVRNDQLLKEQHVCAAGGMGGERGIGTTG